MSVPDQADKAPKSGQQELTPRALHALVWLGSGNGVQIVLRLAVVAVLARLVSPAEYGLVAAASLVISFTDVFSEIGVSSAIIQRQVLENRHLRTGFTMSVGLYLFFGAVVWLCAPAIAGLFLMERLTSILRGLTPMFPLIGVALVADSLLRRDLEFRALAVSQTVSYAVGYGATGILLALKGFGVWALVGATLGQAFVRTALLLRMKPHPKRPLLDRESAGELLYTGGGFTLLRIFNHIAMEGHNFIVARFLGAQVFGIYGRAYNLAAVPFNSLSKVLTQVLFPAMALIQTETPRLSAVYRRGIALSSLIFMPLSAALFVLAPEIVGVLLGPDWTEAVLPFRILALGIVFRTSYKMGDSLGRAGGAVYALAARNAIGAAATLLGVWVGRFWGLAGVATAITAVLGLNFLLVAQLSLRTLSMSWKSFFAAQARGGLLATIVFAELMLLAGILRPLSLPGAILLLLSAVLSLSTSLLLLYRAPSIFFGRDSAWIANTLKRRPFSQPLPRKQNLALGTERVS